jgi:hypothetical protein
MKIDLALTPRAFSLQCWEKSKTAISLSPKFGSRDEGDAYLVTGFAEIDSIHTFKGLLSDC